MKIFLPSLLIRAVAAAATAQNPPKPDPTLSSILLSQLKQTHDKQDWFVPVDQAAAGLTAEQAAWKQGDANHSIA